MVLVETAELLALLQYLVHQLLIQVAVVAVVVVLVAAQAAQTLAMAELME
jgi:hypothetical protein